MTTPNKEQQDVIDHKDGPALILAGPGTGKTFVIVERVQKLVAQNVEPDRILCITFTEKATEEMKTRLAKAGNTKTTVSTFHSFCKEVCTDYFIQSGLSTTSNLMKETSLLVWCLKNTDKFGLDTNLIEKRNLVETFSGMIQAISNFKESLITSKELQAWLEQKKVELEKLSEKEQKKLENKELANYVKLHSEFNKVYAEYEKFQEEKEVYDFDDMISRAIALFKKDDTVLQHYNQKYKYVLVDEFQDNNFSQYELVRLLGKHGNVMVVGDDDQLIMRFQGARQENFDDFMAQHSGVKEKQLGNNYRCVTNTVEVSKLILGKITNRRPKTLSSARKENEKVKVVRPDTDNAQVEFVVDTIRKLLGTEYIDREGNKTIFSFGDFAILSRKKDYGDRFTNALNLYGIPSTHIGNFNIFDSSVISEVISYLKIISSPSSTGMHLHKLMSLNGIDEVNISTINHTAKKAKRHVYGGQEDGVFETMKQSGSLNITQKNEIKEIVETIENAVKVEAVSNVAEIVYKVIYTDISGLYKRSHLIDTPENRVNIMVLNKFYEIAQEFQDLNPDETLVEFLKHLELLRKLEIDLEEKFDIENTVHVMTMHKSKGKQYPVVFITDVVKDRFPGREVKRHFYVHNELLKGRISLQFTKQVKEDDDRRLFYVSVTRAENLLYIMAPKKYEGNKNEKDVSMYLDEIDFEQRPTLIEIIPYKEKGLLQFGPTAVHERIKHETQSQAISSITKMQFGTAINRIIELARIRYFEEHRKDDPKCTGFDPKKVLSVDMKDLNLNQELIGVPRPLFEPKTLTLSNSSLRTYEECPYMFQFSKLERTPTPSNVFLDLGSSIHNMIQDVSKDTGKIPKKDDAITKLKEKWIFKSYQNKSTENTFWKRAEQMTENYLNWRNTNKNKLIKSEMDFDFEYEGVTINGRIDWLEENPNGDYEVVDFKTGKTAVSRAEAEEDWQLNIYARAIEEKYGKLPVKASLYFLDLNKKVEFDVDKKKVDKVLDEKINPIIKKILSSDFTAKPEQYKCGNCDYKDMCEYSKA
jgi:DNA helicase-2/ATP-dependent DNA helicase PcrA